MKKLRMFKKNIVVAQCKDEGKTEFPFYKDDTVIINAKIHYDANSKVEKLVFSGKNIKGNNYKIKHVTFCRDNKFDWGDRFLIHIDKTSSPNSKIHFVIDKTYNSSLLNKLDFKKGNVLPFFFKEYINNPVPDDIKNLNCNMDGTTPKTKDGAIIIGG